MVMSKISEVMNCSAGEMNDFIPDDRNVSVEESVKQKESQESYAFRWYDKFKNCQSVIMLDLVFIIKKGIDRKMVF